MQHRLEAELKFTDEDIYNLYLKNYQWHNNKMVLEAMIAIADNYGNILLEWEEEKTKIEKDNYDSGYTAGYDTGLQEGESKCFDLRDAVERLLADLEVKEKQININMSIGKVRKAL